MFRIVASAVLFSTLVSACDRIHKVYSSVEASKIGTSKDSGHVVRLVNPKVKSDSCTEYDVTGAPDRFSWTYDDSQTGDSSGVCSPDNKCGPSSWQNIVGAPGVNQCGGPSQTPINIKDSIVVGDYPEDISFSVVGGGCSSWSSYTDDHVLEVSFSEPGQPVCGNHAITFQGETFPLKQFHFHTPSEHTFSGVNAAAELHLVHKSAAGHYAVLGVLFQIDDSAGNTDVIGTIATLTQAALAGSAPAEGSVLHCESDWEDKLLNAYSFLPDDKDFYAYSGSLTTYPCTQGINWFVYKNLVPISSFDIEVIRSAVTAYSATIASPEGDDARPTQPLNGRPVYSRSAPQVSLKQSKRKDKQEKQNAEFFELRGDASSTSTSALTSYTLPSMAIAFVLLVTVGGVAATVRGQMKRGDSAGVPYTEVPMANYQGR